MAFWFPNHDKYNSSIWITVFLFIPVLFNNFNVRRYGEIEFWLTVTKVATIIGIIFLGVLLPMGASSATRLLGTDLNTLELVPCPSDLTANITCVGTPGFDCTPPPSQLVLIHLHRLERRRVPSILSRRGSRPISRSLGLLLPSHFLLRRHRVNRHRRRRDRKPKTNSPPLSPPCLLPSRILLHRGGHSLGIECQCE